jgi:UDP-glucose 4-epimerase
MNIVLTGYTGFLGSHLLRQCASKYNFILLGRNTSGENVYDINNTVEVSNALRNSDVIIHSAARAHVLNDKSSDPWHEYVSNNVDLTVMLAQKAIEAGVKRFIFISTLKVNGEGTTSQPFRHNDDAMPYDFYAKSKVHAEIKLKELCANSHMELVIIRPPLVYGEGVKANFMALFKLVTKKFPLPFGSIKDNRRSLVSVYNLVDLIDTCILHPNAANQTFLVSDDNDVSTTEMVKLMAKVQGVKPLLLPIPVWMLKLLGKITIKSEMISRLTDSLQVDISQTKETLGWKPPYSVEEGFAKCIQKPSKHTINNQD